MARTTKAKQEKQEITFGTTRVTNENPSAQIYLGLAATGTSNETRPYLFSIAPNNEKQPDVTTLPTGTLTKPGKSRSVKEWILGLQHGTLRKRVQGYYDNVKSFEEFTPKDVAKLTRIQLLQEQDRIEKFIKSKVDGNQNESKQPKSE